MSRRYILDTDICIHARRQRPDALLARFNSLQRGEAVLSVITYGALLYGARKSSESKRAMQIIEEFENLFEILPVMKKQHRPMACYAATLQREDRLSEATIFGSRPMPSFWDLLW